ncbi:dephospho-CoA kinase [Aestuariivirga litoralis]|uniref:dephospho-CoA kinase n=1 Tax=Aestuariivirga litoralis TaxID=2650924 RepID=UPI0018C5DDFE|nr:dephospho-CoA kinase [Aestuariivirga litoralis]MBG1233777.1 dephospho-CoA kinase [Aestuariivirga litoralis]
MMRIGLTGSIAMGKSEAARYFASRGIPVFDADAEVHRLYDSAEGATLLRPYLPEATAENRVDRKIVTEMIMKDKDLLKKLEQIVHAEIRQRRSAFVAKAEAEGNKAVILDIPLLFETGGEKDVDASIVISSPAHVQEQRALARPGMTKERLAMILARQMPDAEKRKRATYVIENDSTVEHLHKSLAALLMKMRFSAHA